MATKLIYFKLLDDELNRLNCRAAFGKNRTRNASTQWFKDHEHQFQYGLIIKSCRLSLQFAFSWKDTPEGYEFWDSVYDQLPKDAE